MSLRVGSSGGKRISVTRRPAALRRAWVPTLEAMEQRQLLTAVIAPTDPTVAAVTSPLPAMPGHTFYVKGSASTWDQASAITPNTTNDLILHSTPIDSTYVACCEAGATNNIQVFTNGTLASSPPTSPGGVSDASAPDNVVADTTTPWQTTYSLGNNAAGYDISEIDSITGHQDYRTRQNIELEVQFVGSSQFVSLSGGAGFSFTKDASGNLDKGSAQMAIVSDTAGQPIASNVAVVRFTSLAGDPAFFRELVVTGTPSANVPNSAPAAPTGLTAQFQNSAVTLSFTDNATNEFGYLIQRGTALSGPFTTIGTIPASVGSGHTVTFTDTGVGPNSSYFYRVVAFNNFGGGSQTASNVAGPVVIGNVGVEEHTYNQAFWAGPVFSSQRQINVDVTGANGSLAPNDRGNIISAIFTGKVHSQAAGVYTFTDVSNDQGYLYVNGQLASANGTPTPVTLAGNTDYNFVYLESTGGGGAQAQMMWLPPGATSATIVPATALTPLSSTPTTPTALAVDTFNTATPHSVDFTFQSDNVAVVRYLLQRSSDAGTTWTTINQSDPGGSIPDPSNPGKYDLRIQDASAIPGASYQYRVMAMNFDGTSAPSSPLSVNVPAANPQIPGVEGHYFNQELGSQDQGNDPRDAAAVANPTEFQGQSFGILPGSRAPIDATFGDGTNSTPGSPDSFGYPDIPRIHLDSFTTMFTGKIVTDAAGVYTFISNSDDDGYMWVNDVLVSSDPGPHGAQDAPNLIPISLQANTAYNFIVIQTERSGGADVHVSWIEPDGMGGKTSKLLIPAYTPAAPGSAAVGGFEQVMDVPHHETVDASGNITDVPAESAAAAVAVSSEGSAGTVVSWTDQSTSEVWFDVQRATDPGFTQNLTTFRAGFDRSSFADTTAIPSGTTFYYRVRGANWEGAGPWSSTSGDTGHIKLRAPNASAINCFPGVVTLSWNDTGQSETAYAVYDSTTQGGPYTLVANLPADTTSYDVTGLNPASKYYFVVKAVGGGIAADSPNSTEISSRASGGAPIQHGPNDGNNHFTDATDLTLNGDAFINSSGQLQLDKPPTAFSTGTAYTTLPEGVASFDTTFQLTAADASSSGFAFVIQSVDPHQVGVTGAGLGYGGVPNSVAIKFRLTGGRNDTGLYTDGTTGDAPAQNLSTTPAPLNTAVHMNLSPGGTATGLDFHANSSDVYQVHLTYDGTTLTEVVTDVTSNVSVTQTYTINIDSVVGGPCAFVGLTASTGSGTMQVNILNWTGTFNAGTTPVFSQSVNGTAGNDTITVKNDSDGLHDDIWVGPTTGTPTQEALIGQTIVINGGGGTDTLTLDSSNGNPLPTGGLHPTLRLISGTGKFVLGGTLPTIDADHVVDVGKSTLDIPYTGTSPLPAIQSLLKSGQIKSTDAAGSGGKFAVADTDAAGKVTLSYRVVGDLNGDGTVGFADLLALAQHYNNTGADWSKGDLNYDGTVNFSDLLALAQHYNQTAASAPVAAASSTLASDTLTNVLRKKARLH